MASPLDQSSTHEDFRTLNARLNIAAPDGSLQLESDREAVRQYFLQEVNNNTVFFHNLEEKLHYLVREGYYESEVLEQYSEQFIKSLFKQAYAHKFRFKSFLGAYKYYSSYTLKNFSGDRYLERYEDRVSMVALYLARGDEGLARTLVDEIITGRFQPATPTFLNAGKKQRGELVSCFLLRTEDDLESISRNITNALQLSKRGGGVALNLSNLREVGAPIKKIENQSSGVVPVMKLLEDSFSYANQLGARQGAGAVYLHAHHPDIMRFLDTKRENADEKIRIKTLSTGVVIPDITMKLVRDNEDMYLFSPYDVEREYGRAFTEVDVTEEYYKMVENPNIRKSKIKARKLLQTIAELQFESGYPYILFEGNANRSNPIDGRITMSNLCVTGETELLTDEGYVPIRELFESQKDFKVVVDERARTMNLEASGVSTQDSTRVFKTAENADILKLTTREGFSLRATPWHKMYVKREEELLKIDLRDVRVGDKVLVQPAEGAFGTSSDEALAYLTGVLTGDGTIVEGANYSTARFYLYGEKAKQAPVIEKAIAQVLAGRDDLIERQSTLTPTFGTYKGGRMSLHSAPLAKVLAEKGLTKNNKLQVPEFVKRGDRATQIAYLSGLFQMDGCITGGGPSIELVSISRELLNDVQLMLTGLGVYSRVYDRRDETYAVLPGPDGDSRLYHQSKAWMISVNGKHDGRQLYELLDWREEQDEAMSKIVAGYRSDKVYKTHRYFATVDSISEDGTEDVYDVTVDNGHSIIFNGIATGNCSEILQVSTPSTFTENGYYDELGKDISCNLGSMNIARAFDSEDFAGTVEAAVRALTSVSDLSNIASVPSIENGNSQSHAIGLGQMNLHGFLGREHIHYDSPEAVDFTNLYFYAVLYQALKASTKIAQETGEKFVGFERSKYASGEFFEKYITKDWSVAETPKVRDLMTRSSIYLPTPSDWEALRDEVMEHGLYHQNLLAVPPTGSISYINHATSSIHPIASRIEARKEGRIGKVYFAPPEMTNENVEYFDDAYEIGPEAILNVYAAATEHVDQGLSCTLFYTDQATTGSLIKNYVSAWNKGIKTLYYVRIQRSVLAGTEVAGVGAGRKLKPAVAPVAPAPQVVADDDDSDECESCML